MLQPIPGMPSPLTKFIQILDQQKFYSVTKKMCQFRSIASYFWLDKQWRNAEIKSTKHTLKKTSTSFSRPWQISQFSNLLVFPVKSSVFTGSYNVCLDRDAPTNHNLELAPGLASAQSPVAHLWLIDALQQNLGFINVWVLSQWMRFTVITQFTIFT